jgi:hypothetical protein
MARFEPRGSVSRPVVEWLSEGVRKRANLSDGDAGADRESAHGRDRSLIGAPRSRPSRDAGHHLPGSWFSRYSWTRTFLQSRNLLPKAPPGAHRRTRPRPYKLGEDGSDGAPGDRLHSRLGRWTDRRCGGSPCKRPRHAGPDIPSGTGRLSGQGISIAVFFIVPNSGDATSSVARSLGLQGTRRRELRGTTTLDQESRDAAA